MKAIARALRITPKKLNLIALMVRNKDAKDALEILKYTPKKSAKILLKVLKSAISNAENNFKQDIDSLYVKEVVVGKATTFKRWLPASRGRAQPILKRNAHVTVTIGVREMAEPKAAKHGSSGSQAEQAEPTKKARAPRAKKATKAS